MTVPGAIKAGTEKQGEKFAAYIVLQNGHTYYSQVLYDTRSKAYRVAKKMRTATFANQNSGFEK